MEEKQKKPVNKKRIILIIVLVVVVGGIIGLISYCTASLTKEVDYGTVEKVEKRDIKKTVPAAGVIDSIDYEEIATPVVGAKVKKMYVKKGDYVTPGQIVCQLDTTDLQSQYIDLQKSISEAKADKLKTNQQFDQQIAEDRYDRDTYIAGIRQELNVAQGELNSASTELDKQRNRYNQYISDPNNSEWDMEAIEMESSISELESKQIIAFYKVYAYQSTLDSVQSGEDPEASYNDIRSSINQMSDSTIKSLEDIANSLAADISNSTVRSTVGGVITTISVRDGDTYYGGTICTVEGINSFMVNAEVSEDYIGDVAVGQKVRIKTKATGDQDLMGTVSYVAPRATMTATGNGYAELSSVEAGAGSTITSALGSSAKYLVKVALDEQNPKIKLGMNATLLIITGEEPNTLSVSNRAVRKDDDGSSYVEVVTNYDKVADSDSPKYDKQKVTVNVGIIGDYTEIHGTGISEDTDVYVPDATDANSLEELYRMFSGSSGSGSNTGTNSSVGTNSSTTSNSGVESNSGTTSNSKSGS